MQLWLLAICLLISSAVYAEESDAVDDASSEEAPFQLKDYLNLGYHLSKTDIRRNKKILQDQSDVPLKYLIDLYNEYLEHRAVDPKNVDLSDSNIICFPDGKCVNIGGPEVHPDKAKVEDLEEYQPFKNVICFPNGKCVDLDDPGIHPKHNQDLSINM